MPTEFVIIFESHKCGDGTRIDFNYGDTIDCLGGCSYVRSRMFGGLNWLENEIKNLKNVRTTQTSNKSCENSYILI